MRQPNDKTIPTSMPPLRWLVRVEQPHPCSHPLPQVQGETMTPDPIGKLTEIIYEALRDYRMEHTYDEDGGGFDLVNCVTPPGAEDITLGIEELEELAVHVADAIHEAEVDS